MKTLTTILLLLMANYGYTHKIPDINYGYNRNDTLDTIGKAVISGMKYRELYYWEKKKSESYELELRADSLTIKNQSKAIDDLNSQLIESLKDRGVSETLVYIVGILSGVAVGSVVYLIWGE